MEKPISALFFLLLVYSSAAAAHFDAVVINSTLELANYTTISDFRVINRRKLSNCLTLNRHITITVTPVSSLPNDGVVTVKVTGIMFPSKHDWVGMVTSSNADRSSACPFKKTMYQQTGDLGSLPLLCHYPIKAQYLKNDPDYLGCKKKAFKEDEMNSHDNAFWNRRCSATLSFHVVNIRTDIEFILFGNGFLTPCIRARSSPIVFANPKMPMYGHLSSVDSTATSMKLTWVSGDSTPQNVQFGDGKSQVASTVTTFTQKDMCTSALPSPAKDFGWHDPGFIHSAVMTGLKPSTAYTYRYGSDSVGWSNEIQFRTPPPGGADELKFISYGDMGKTPRDSSIEHYIQPGALSVAQALTDEVASGNVDSIFHIGDMSYATGFLVEWDYFLNLISPIASKVSYMTAIGNHESNYVNTASKYITPDSGGECGVPYEKYFPMPTAGKDKPWYSIEQGPVHFTVISTEHDWTEDSEQYAWIKSDLASVDRSKTPWLIFMGHRPMYSSIHPLLSVDYDFVSAVEPLLFVNKVDLALFGHVHVYERTCAVYKGKCLGMPVKDQNGIDTYDTRKYTAPVHAIIGMAGFKLDKFPSKELKSWSVSRHSDFGYARFKATRKDLIAEFVNSNSRKVQDSFHLTK
ncbi:hypothetical protein QQ045_027778 [Rhodiola kirilowii]